ncbi:MAG: hypothetical protein GEU94_10105 [Micromonosporaceae bacterium]|nr:hypothetical protein [Micromonosporaceae bacterium]
MSGLCDTTLIREQPASPAASLTDDEWLLRGMLRCLACQRPMIPARWVDQDGTRVYSCGPACPQRDLVAAEIEDHLFLGALIRDAMVATRCSDADPPVSPDELDRWRATDAYNRRAVLETAFAWVEITATGQARPEWQHDLRQPSVAAQTPR